MSLAWQTLQLSLAGGLETKDDPRAADPRQMDICRDVRFDETRGAQTRFPYAALGASIFGGGTISNARRLEANGEELVLFTDTQVYSWNAQISQWVLRGTHLAVSVEETPRFVSPGDQIDGDRAELQGTVVFAWSDGGAVYVAALDKTTGSVLMAPTSLGGATARPRVVATATRILVFYVFAGELRVIAINPASPALTTTGTVSAANVSGPYDVVKVEGQDIVVGAFKRTVTTSYTAFTVTAGLTIATSTKARVCDGPIAVASTLTTGLQTQIIRGNTTNIQGDLLTTSTLADVFTAQAIGTATTTTINQITVAFATSTTAFAYWTSGSLGETATFTDFTVKTNSVTTANVVGTQSTFRHRLGIASRAFTYSGHAYVWLVFASESGTTINGNASGVRAQLQNTYFLYRDDVTLHGRCVYNLGGGFAPTTGRLPGVVSLDTDEVAAFAWCATARRRIELGASADHTGFGSRSTRDVTFIFDSNAARRCTRIGATMYVAASIPLQYDGLTLTEVGFLYYPWFFDPQVGAAGLLGAGTYTWKATMRWANAQGEIDRSTTATGMSLTIAALKFVFMNYLFLNVTMKTSPRPPAIDFWRTSVDPLSDSPFFLVSSQNPDAGIVDNGYVINVDTSDSGTPLPDNFPDATLITKETNPENGSILEYLAPPGATIIFATDTRVFLAGVPGDPDSVWYSRLRLVGEVASFHDSLTIPVPPAGGAITALAFLNETLVVFRETCIYALPGVGFDNLGQGNNFGPANRLASDVGAIDTESVVLTPMGLIFKSRKGWYLLERSWQPRYIGSAVAEFDEDTVLSAHVVETEHQVRIATSARVLMWDYNAVTESAPTGQWSEWTIDDALHATVWNGSHVYLATGGPQIEQTTFSGLTYGIDIESSWIKMQDLQGAARVRWIEILGEWRSSHRLRIRVARDYQYDSSGEVEYFDDVSWVPSTTTVGAVMQVRHPVTQGQVEALKVRITAVSQGASATLDCLVGLSFPVVTNGVSWDAGYLALAAGEPANNVSMSLSFVEGTPFSFDIRDHFEWSEALQRWIEHLDNVGIKVTCATGSSPTVAQLEAAILASSTLVEIDTPDTTPAKVINASFMINVTTLGFAPFGQFAGGAFASPSGEACRLTGLGLEVGLKPGLYRRLAAAQKV